MQRKRKPIYQSPYVQHKIIWNGEHLVPIYGVSSTDISYHTEIELILDKFNIRYFTCDDMNMLAESKRKSYPYIPIESHRFDILIQFLDSYAPDEIIIITRVMTKWHFELLWQISAKYIYVLRIVPNIRHPDYGALRLFVSPRLIDICNLIQYGGCVRGPQAFSDFINVLQLNLKKLI